MLSSERFYQFVRMIDGLHKYIQKIRVQFSPTIGIKSVHVFWIYTLRDHPEGLTAAELAAKSRISRSLISREIEDLRADGYIKVQENARGKRANYNSRIFLTEKGQMLAQSIAAEGMNVQTRVNAGISEEELQAFYQTLQKLQNNLCAVAEESDSEEAV